MIQDSQINKLSDLNSGQAEKEFQQVAPHALAVESLTGLVDFAMNNLDGIDMHECMVVIRDHKWVEFCGKIGLFHREGKTRPFHLIAKLNEKIEPFPFDEFLEHEEFVIALMTRFVWSDDLKEFITKISKIKNESVQQVEDTGIASKQAAEKGVKIAYNDSRMVIKLQPFRTFAEVEQPATSFIFRTKAGREGEISCALFECDGGAWMNDARKNIKTYLVSKMATFAIGLIRSWPTSGELLPSTARSRQDYEKSKRGIKNPRRKSARRNLAEGDAVQFVEETTEKGLQASQVKRL